MTFTCVDDVLYTEEARDSMEYRSVMTHTYCLSWLVFRSGSTISIAIKSMTSEAIKSCIGSLWRYQLPLRSQLSYLAIVA